MKILLLKKYNKIFAISDLHGNKKAFLAALKNFELLDYENNLHLQSEEYFIINGDLFDFYNKTKTNNDGEKMIKLQKEMTKNKLKKLFKNYQISNSDLISFINSAFHKEVLTKENKNIYEKLKKRLSETKIKIEILSALKVLDLLFYLQNQANYYPKNLLFILGNHDLDFLNLEWEYKSLQKNLIYCFLTDTLVIKYRELKDVSQNLEYISCGKINRKLLKLKIKEKLPFLNTFYHFVISNNLYVHGGIPRVLLTKLNSLEKLNTKIFSQTINKNIANYLSKSDSHSILICDQSPDLPTENSIEINKLLNKLKLKNLVVGHNPFLGLKQKEGQKFDIENPKVKKYISNIQKIDRIIKIDTGIKFGNIKAKIFEENTAN